MATATQESSESDRLARLEATVDYLVREVGDIKVMVGREIGSVRDEVGSVRNELGGVRSEMGDIRVALREEMHIMQEAMDRIRQESRRDLRLIIGTFIGVMVPTWAFIATALIVGLS